MMHRKLRDDWVEALRSRSYKQGRGFMHNSGDNTWCCLGVLAIFARMRLTEKSGYPASKGKFGQSELRKLGLTEVQQRHLIDMNDGAPGLGFQRSKSSHPKGFSVIANWIENNIGVKS